MSGMNFLIRFLYISIKIEVIKAKHNGFHFSLDESANERVIMDGWAVSKCTW
jgi:hypothetical protein